MFKRVAGDAEAFVTVLIALVNNEGLSSPFFCFQILGVFAAAGASTAAPLWVAASGGGVTDCCHS